MKDEKKACPLYGRTVFSGCAMCAAKGGKFAECASLAALAEYNAEHANKSH